MTDTSNSEATKTTSTGQKVFVFVVTAIIMLPLIACVVAFMVGQGR